MIGAGQRNRQVTIRSITRVDDESGGHTETLTDIVVMWMHVEPLEGNEQLRAMQTGMTRPHRFTGNYREDITGATELFYDGRRFNVTSVVDPNSRRREMVILADEAVV